MSLIEIFDKIKTLSDDEKKELIQRLYVIEPWRLAYNFAEEIIYDVILDDNHIKFGRSKYYVYSITSSITAGYYKKFWIAEYNHKTAIVILLNTDETNNYTYKDLSVDKFHYKVYCDKEYNLSIDDMLNSVEFNNDTIILNFEEHTISLKLI
jgi:hypothetical protein